MKKIPLKPDAARAARIFGISIERAKEMYAKNSAQMSAMADKAAKTGRLVNGYSESELRATAGSFLTASL